MRLLGEVIRVLYVQPSEGIPPMTKKLTITVPDDVYEGLHTVVGPRRISRFLSDLARPHVVRCDLAEAYQEMAHDEVRERDAREWADSLVGDVAPE